MDFSTAQAPPINITVDGKPYSVPRFLTPELTILAAKKTAEVREAAVAHLNPEDRARVLMFFQSPPIDVADLVAECRSPEGYTYVLNEQLEKAGVPAETRQNMIAWGDPVVLRNLSVAVTSGSFAEAQLRADSGEGQDGPKNPTKRRSKKSSATSAALPATGPTTPQSSQAPTAANQND